MTSPARVFATENRLAKVARLPGGKSIDEAVRHAEAKVAGVRERCIAALSGKASELVVELAALKTAETPNFDRAYAVSNSVYGVAGAFALPGLAEAAASLCDLIEGVRGGDRINWAALDVHVDGIRLLIAEGEGGAQPVLAGLRRVRARFVPET